jgi:hypothetical protein
MAGKVVVSTLNNDTGVLATQNGMTGIAKAWVQFQGGIGNTAGVINGSFNVSSITVNGTGDYRVNYTTAMPNANYAASCTTQGDTGGGNNTYLANIANNSGAIATGSIRVKTQASQSTSVPLNVTFVCVAIFSS